jgi:hypothetical protein
VNSFGIAATPTQSISRHPSVAPPIYAANPSFSPITNQSHPRQTPNTALNPIGKST